MAVSKVEDISQNNDDVEISKKDKKARKRKKGIYRKIVAQMEFYLSDANLRHSKFLLPIYQTDPWIDLKLFLTFNKVASMSATHGAIFDGRNRFLANKFRNYHKVTHSYR